MIEKGVIYKNESAIGYINDYDTAMNPSVINEHASAAFRYFHNQIQGKIK